MNVLKKKARKKVRNEIIVDKLGTPLMSKILIKVQDTFDEFTTKGGIIAKSDVNKEAWSDSEGHNLSEFIPRHGEVVKMPRSINPYGWDYFTDCEIEVGDTVYWSIVSFENVTVLVYEGQRYVQIDYHALLIRIRDGKILPINGNVLFSPVPIEKKYLDHVVVEPITDRWTIYQLPEKVPVSKIARRNGDVSMWSKGDRVITLLNKALIKIEGDINKSLDKDLFTCPIFMILCNVKKD